VARAQQYVREGYEVVVDIDLEKFFDRVCHDKLMGELAKRVEDKRMLKLIRAFLNAGVMDGGLVEATTQGVPQGGPLSPVLSNLVLDRLDKEIERRGHRFCRYADDARIFVRSERAGHRVMDGIKAFITSKLNLRVNRDKSAVAPAWERPFLGFRLTKGEAHKRAIAPQALRRFMRRVRELTRRSQGRSMEQVVGRLASYLRGWIAYFGFVQTRSVLRDLDSWIRRRLRNIIWKQWKVYRRRRQELMRRGINEIDAVRHASRSYGPWRMSRSKAMHVAFPAAYFDSLGLPRLADVCAA
jgi:RNA-directed DNA polymerase